MRSLLSQSWWIRHLASALEQGVGPAAGDDPDEPAARRTSPTRPLPAFTPAVLGQIHACYPQLSAGWQVQRAGLGNIGRGCLLASGPRRYFLKWFDPGSRDADDIREEHQVIRHLVASRFPTPAVLADRDGDTVVLIDGQPYALYEAAAGDDVYAGDPVFGPFRSPAHAASAGQTMARFHRAMEHYPDAPKKPFHGLTAQYDLMFEPDLFEGLRDMLADWPELRCFVLAQPELPLLLDLLEAYRRQLIGLRSGMPWSVIHGDFIKRNLFFAGDEVAAVIDFDLCNLAPRLYDVCLALQPVAFPWDRLLHGKGGTNEADARAFLDGYQSLVPLRAQELAALPAVLATCRFEFYLGLVGLELRRGDKEGARRWFEFQVHVLRWFSAHPDACDFLAR